MKTAYYAGLTGTLICKSSKHTIHKASHYFHIQPYGIVVTGSKQFAINPKPLNLDRGRLFLH